MTNNIDKQSFGQDGAVFVSDSHADQLSATGDFCAFQVIADTVLSSITWPELTDTYNLFTGTTLPAGLVVYGQFTAITVTSGSILCYKAAK